MEILLKKADIQFGPCSLSEDTLQLSHEPALPFVGKDRQNPGSFKFRNELITFKFNRTFLKIS